MLIICEHTPADGGDLPLTIKAGFAHHKASKAMTFRRAESFRWACRRRSRQGPVTPRSRRLDSEPSSEPEQCLLDNFCERRMDVQDAGGHLRDRIAQAHCLNERLNQDRGVRADDVCAEQQTAVRVSQDLDESSRVLQCPAICRAAIGAGRAQIPSALSLQVLL